MGTWGEKRSKEIGRTYQVNPPRCSRDIRRLPPKSLLELLREGVPLLRMCKCIPEGGVEIVERGVDGDGVGC